MTDATGGGNRPYRPVIRSPSAGLPEAVRKIPLYVSLWLFGLLMLRIFTLNVSGSMPLGLYMRLPPFEISTGDLVELDNPLLPGLWNVNVRSGLLKRVTDISSDGLYYVRGEDPYSYDSRFYGWVGEEYITHKVLAIWQYGGKSEKSHVKKGRNDVPKISFGNEEEIYYSPDKDIYR